jgi:hypothetical protein
MVAAMNSQSAATLTGERFFDLLGGHCKNTRRRNEKTKKQKAKGKRQKAKMEKTRNGRQETEGEERKARSRQPETGGVRREVKDGRGEREEEG